MRKLPAILIALTLLQACAADTEGVKDRGKPVIDAYQDPLLRGGVLGGAASNGPEGSDPAARAAPGPEPGRLANLEPGEKPSLTSDEAGLWMRGDRREERLLASGKVVDDSELTGYVRDIVCKLAGKYCADVRVYIVNQPGFNAKMAPNGAMEIWTGALLRLRSEAELAAVIGHELGHYLRRHSLQEVRATRTKLASFINNYAGTSTARAGFFDLVGSLSGFSRENEREADGYGLRLLAEAGYDPVAVPTLWTRLGEEFETIEAYRNQSAFYATHPLLKERGEILGRLAQEVRGKMATEPTLGRKAYLDRTASQRAAFLRDELAEGEFEQLEALLDSLLADADPNPAELLYFKGEVYRLRNGEGDMIKAVSNYEASLLEKGDPPAEIHRSRGLALRRLGAPESSVIAFRAYLSAVPEAEDRALVEDLIAGLEAQ